MSQDAQSVPAPPVPVFDAQASDVRFCAYDFDTQENIRLRLYLALPRDVPPAQLENIELRVISEGEWQELLASMRIDFANELEGERLPKADTEKYAELRKILATKRGIAFVAPRGIGRTAWSGSKKEKTHLRRRFMLLGQTLDGMRIWDVRSAIKALRSTSGFENVPLTLTGDGEMAGIAMYAALFEPDIAGISVSGLPASHRDGPDLLNVLRYLDLPQVVAMAAEQSHVRIEQSNDADWEYPLAVSRQLGWTKGIEIVTAADGTEARSESSDE